MKINVSCKVSWQLFNDYLVIVKYDNGLKCTFKLCKMQDKSIWGFFTYILSTVLHDLTGPLQIKHILTFSVHHNNIIKLTYRTEPAVVPSAHFAVRFLGRHSLCIKET